MERLEETWNEIQPSQFSQKSYHPGYKLLNELNQYFSTEKKPLSFVLGEPSETIGALKMHQTTRDEAKKAILDPLNHECFDPAGPKNSRIALAKFYSLPNYEVPPENVIITHGGCAGLGYIARTL